MSVNNLCSHLILLHSFLADLSLLSSLFNLLLIAVVFNSQPVSVSRSLHVQAACLPAQPEHPSVIEDLQCERSEDEGISGAYWPHGHKEEPPNPRRTYIPPEISHLSL